MNKSVSIIIPVYNEEKFIFKLIEKIKKIDFASLSLDCEIIVVNDGSTDNTKKILSKIDNIKVIDQINLGKGSAVQKGIKYSKADLILIQDADLEYDPNDYYSLLEPFKSDEKISVYGSRPKNVFNKESLFEDKHHNQKYGPYFMNKLLCFFFKFLFNITLTDPLTGYKVYERNFFLKNKIYSTGFEADHEITVKLMRSNYRFVEVPIKYNPRTVKEGKKINFLDAVIAFYILFKLKLMKY